MELEILNLTQICRTCKCTSLSMRSLFEGCENPHQAPRIDEMLMACASVQVVCGDGLPAQICEICVSKLKEAFTFRRQCEEVDENLKWYAKNVKVNEIKQEFNSDFIEPPNTLSDLLNEQSSGIEPNQDAVIPKIEADYIQFLENDEMLRTCRECSKIFTTVKGLRWHEESHKIKKVHMCKICKKTIGRLEHLKRHLVTHMREKPFSCGTCNRVFSRVAHLHNHTPKCKKDIVYPCDICTKAFNREDSMLVHRQMHESQPKLPTIDNLDNVEEHYVQIDQEPDMTFSDYSDTDDCFEPHVETTEGVDESAIKETADDDQSNVSEVLAVRENVNNDMDDTVKTTESLEYEGEDALEVKVEENVDMVFEEHDIKDDIDAGGGDCDSTDTEYHPKRGRGRPRKHSVKIKIPGRGRGRPPKAVKKEENEEEYGKFPCPACQEMFNTMRSLNRHARMNHEGLKIYKCSECDKEFSRTNHLRRHMTTHSTIKPFQCNVCTKGFNRSDHLTQHQRLHDRSYDLECDICQKAFSRPENLANHKASKHGVGKKVLTEKKYDCPLCLKSFTTEKYRDVHVRGHDRHKEYNCKVCKKAFPSKSRRNEHMKFHDEHAKKFLCSECGQRFIRNDYLVIHMRRHRGEKPFKCKYCEKGFPRTTDLTNHERLHTGEKPHMCTECGRGFGRAYNLKLHMRTHTGEKPYRCTYCDAAFSQSNDLRAHSRRHTGERFQCDLCSDSFLTGSLLTQHKRAVHSI